MIIIWGFALSRKAFELEAPEIGHCQLWRQKDFVGQDEGHAGVDPLEISFFYGWKEEEDF